MRVFKTLLILVIMGSAFFLSPGCSDNEVVKGPEIAENFALAVTPDILLENFALAFATRDIALYGEILDEDFAFTFLPCDVADLGLKSNHWNREDELKSATRMFSGKPHIRDDHTFVAAITVIEFLEMQQITPWSQAGDPDRDGVLRATFDMKVRFGREGAGDLVVAGPSIFYAVPVADKRGVDRYRLLGWVDRSKVCEN
jgi:hypothetical protein